MLVAPSDCAIGATTTYAIGQVSDEHAINMPPSVGLQMPPKSSGLRMMLSVHYFNMGATIDDTSGVEVCIARTPREHTASPQIVRTVGINLPPHQATNIATYCTAKYDGDIHFVQMLPHMHARGTRLDSVIERANGTRETLIDVPFDFNNQIGYASDVVLKHGDKITTTCHFQNDTDRAIGYGTGTSDEMCGNTITAWPAGALYVGQPAGDGDGCFE